MALSRNQTIVASVFMVVAMGTVVSMIYRASTGRLEQRRREYQQRADAAQPVRRTTVMTDRIVLIRDEAAEVDRIRMVYRGIEDDRILLDVYLLDLDPAYPYSRRISVAEAEKGIRIGPRGYRLKSVSRKSLVLRFAQ